MYKQELYTILKDHVKPKGLKQQNRYSKWKYGYNKDHDMIVISRNGKIKILDENNIKYSSNIPFGSKILVNDLTCHLRFL